MILPDVNVLLYAFRADSVEHERYRDWLENVLNGSETYGISAQVLCSLIRISTHPRIFARPSRLEDAREFARTLFEQPNASLVEPGERHWLIFEQLCLKTGARGNLVQDAWFAALAIESSCEWITTDRDYARFPGLRWRQPWD
jgi:toxin-antitoxin system PIN domain toxin